MHLQGQRCFFRPTRWHPAKAGQRRPRRASACVRGHEMHLQRDPLKLCFSAAPDARVLKCGQKKVKPGLLRASAPARGRGDGGRTRCHFGRQHRCCHRCRRPAAFRLNRSLTISGVRCCHCTRPVLPPDVPACRGSALRRDPQAGQLGVATQKPPLPRRWTGHRGMHDGCCQPYACLAPLQPGGHCGGR